jgi:hypothetical protein
MSKRTIFLVVVIACALGASITFAGSPNGNRKEKTVPAAAINQAMIVNNLKAALGKLQPGTASRIGGEERTLSLPPGCRRRACSRRIRFRLLRHGCPGVDRLC